MPLSFWEIVGLYLAGVSTVAVILGIFLAINAWLIRREREKFSAAQRKNQLFGLEPPGPSLPLEGED